MIEKAARQLLEVQTAVLEQIAAADPLPAVLDTLVRGIERLSEGMIASVLLIDGAQLRHGAAPVMIDKLIVAKVNAARPSLCCAACCNAGGRREPAIIDRQSAAPGR